jgi:signal peptidase I
MSTPARAPGPFLRQWAQIHAHLPTLPHAVASLLQTIVVALFVLTFVLQPFLIPSASMERTLLVGDFLLCNKQIYGPAGRVSKWLLPYQPVQRGDIIVFHHSQPPMLIKRVVGIPGDRLRISGGHVIVNGVALNEPYAAFESAPNSSARDNFPGDILSDPDFRMQVDPDWWRQVESLTRDGELVVPPGEYFVLGDNRNRSLDSRFWGFVPLQAIIARPMVIYFSVSRPYSTDVQQIAQIAPQPIAEARQPTDDRLGHERDLAERIAGFARWRRIFHVVH